MTPEIAAVLAILALAVILFVTEWIRVDVVALMVLVALALTGLVTPTQALSGFANLAVVTVWAVLILSAALARTGEFFGLHERLFIIRLPDASALAGKTLAESRLGQALGLYALAILRADENRLAPDPAAILRPGDRLLGTFGVDITPLLASVGVAGLAVSLGTQSLIKTSSAGCSSSSRINTPSVISSRWARWSTSWMYSGAVERLLPKTQSGGQAFWNHLKCWDP